MKSKIRVKLIVSICFVLALAGLVLIAACTKPAPAPTTTSPKPAPAPTTTAPAPIPITLTLTSVQPDTILNNQGIKRWAEDVTNRTNGAVKFQFFWGGALTKAGEELSAVEKNLANMGSISVTYYPGNLELANWTYVTPFGPGDLVLVMKAAEKLYEQVPALRNEIENYNQKILWLGGTGTTDMVSKKPVKTLDDLKGIKIGAVGKYAPKAFEAIGAVPVTVPAPEKYQGLQTGLIEADWMPLEYSVAYKLHELAKNCTLLEYGANFGWAITINKSEWAKLSPSIQQAMLDAGKEASAWIARETGGKRDAAIQTIKDSGGTIYTLSQSDKEIWAAKLNFPSEWATEMAAKDKPGKDIINAWVKACADLGYKWSRDWTIK